MRHRRPTRASRPPQQFTLVYDEGCPFCTAVAFWLQRRAREPLNLLTFPEVPDSGLLTALRDNEMRAAAHFVTPNGIEYHAGEAVTQSLRLARFGQLAAILDLPGLSFVREMGYEAVALSRPVLSRLIHP